MTQPMEHTEVYVMLANADARYVFPVEQERFMKVWHNHIAGCGYFTGNDIYGDVIIINPSQSSTVKISKKLNAAAFK